MPDGTDFVPDLKATRDNVWNLIVSFGIPLETLSGVPGQLGTYKFQTNHISFHDGVGGAEAVVDGKISFPNDTIPGEKSLQEKILRPAVGEKMWEATKARRPSEPKPETPPNEEGVPGERSPK